MSRVLGENPEASCSRELTLHRLTFGRLRRFGRLDAGLLLLSILSSAAYLATRGIWPGTGGVVIKALSIAPLAVLAFRVLGKAGALLATSSSRSILVAISFMRCGCFCSRTSPTSCSSCGAGRARCVPPVVS